MKNKKQKTRFVCQVCGADTLRWQGKCPACGEWNSLVEEVIRETKRKADSGYVSKIEPIPLSKIEYNKDARIPTKSCEFNRVLGGGIVPGSVVLVGGDPGIGKSTLMLQEGTRLSRNDFKVLYVTGEESAQQTKLRGERLGLGSDFLYVLPETDLDEIFDQANKLQPNMIIVDSIQTIYLSELSSAPGSVSQVRECALRLMGFAKGNGVPVFLIGHVTKEGFIAGPKVLEHMVDCLLLFEGDRDHFYRILRAAKNRFGSTREIGVFEMTDQGLIDVNNPSEQFLAERREDTSGSTVVCVLEGTRAILVELQALVSPSNYGLPQRRTTGLDAKRVSLLIAVLEKRIGMNIGTMDVFVNAVGGIRISETSADLGVLTCIASNVRNRVVDPKALILGEVGLGGEVRAVSQMDKRLAEAEKMGFEMAVIPRANLKGLRKSAGLKIHGVSRAEEALEVVLQ